jgi:hypothetical protein
MGVQDRGSRILRERRGSGARRNLEERAITVGRLVLSFEACRWWERSQP